MQRYFSIVLIAPFVIVFGSSVPVSAGGYEFPGDGTRAIGRGGAFAARSDDPMAIVTNPAALASLPGTQLWVTTHALFAKSCFLRQEGSFNGQPTPSSYDLQWGTTANGGAIPFQEQCNQKSKRLTFIPALAVTWRLSDKIGMGFGIIPPNSERAQRWGSRDRDLTVNGATQPNRRFSGYIDAPPGSIVPGSGLPSNLDGIVPSDGLLPSAARYLLVARDTIVVYPTIAMGIKPVKWLQLGWAFGAGIAHAEFTNALRNVLPGENPSTFEGEATLSGWDWFTPRVEASIHFIPIDNLDIVALFRWDSDVVLNDSRIVAAVPEVDQTPLDGTINQGTTNDLVGDATLRAPRPWWLTFGIRYSDRIVPRSDDPDEATKVSGRIDDPMSTERWDIELDVTYENNSQVDNLTVDLENLDAVRGSSLISDPINLRIQFPHLWQDQLSIRLGSDWNIMPGFLALRAGFSYETSGLRNGFFGENSGGGSVDFFPLQRFGLHMGFTTRIKERLDISGAFSYFRLSPERVENGLVDQVVINPFGGGSQIGPDQGATIVNNGTFSSRQIVLSASVRYIFPGRRGR